MHTTAFPQHFRVCSRCEHPAAGYSPRAGLHTGAALTAASENGAPGTATKRVVARRARGFARGACRPRAVLPRSACPASACRQWLQGGSAWRSSQVQCLCSAVVVGTELEAGWSQSGGWLPTCKLELLGSRCVQRCDKKVRGGRGLGPPKKGTHVKCHPAIPGGWLMHRW